MNRQQREIKPLVNQPTNSKEVFLKAEIKRVNAILRETHNPHEYKQNKRRLERLERELQQCQRRKQ